MLDIQALLDAIVATPWLAAVAVGFVGLCVGSFLNVVIYRMPLIMESEWRNDCAVLFNDQSKDQLIINNTPTYVPMTLSQPASRCPSCGHKIHWYENIPLVSWLALRGRCSACATAIGVRYPIVELLTLIASLAVLSVFGPTLQMVFALGLTWALIALTGIDFDTQLLPDRITLPLAGAGLLINSQGIFVSPAQAILGYVIGFLILWVVYYLFKIITGKEGMGYGDFKLLAALGAWLGPMQLPLIILLSSFVGAIIGLVLLKVRQESQPFAFGPFIAIAGWISLMWGNELVAGYLGMYQ
jgi:leader peptidase (prepilin peptidase) / N-methyltransferase